MYRKQALIGCHSFLMSRTYMIPSIHFIILCFSSMLSSSSKFSTSQTFSLLRLFKTMLYALFSVTFLSKTTAKSPLTSVFSLFCKQSSNKDSISVLQPLNFWLSSSNGIDFWPDGHEFVSIIIIWRLPKLSITLNKSDPKIIGHSFKKKKTKIWIRYFGLMKNMQ